MRGIPGRIFEKSAIYTGAAVAIAAALGLGCVDWTTEIEALEPPAADAAAPVEAVAPSSDVMPASPRGSEALYRQLREEADQSTGASVIATDERLRAAESEFPLEFRFSYERAKLAVFGHREHHEAFGRLRRAAEKAIGTGRSEAMLEMLSSDGAPSGPFWKLARGHSEWHRVLAALEHGDRDALRHERHETRAAIRVEPETHAEPEALDSPRTAVWGDGLDRLRLVRARIDGAEAPEAADRMATDAHAAETDPVW